MPVLRYFIVVGLFLIGMLYVADAVLPRNTRLQVTSNFEGIPPAPQRPVTRPVLVPAPELRDVVQSSVPPPTEVKQAPNLLQPEPLRPSTSDPAAAPQAVEAPKLGEPELAMSPTAVPAAAAPQAEEPPRRFKSAFVPMAKRPPSHKKRKHIARERERRHDNFAQAHSSGFDDWSRYENEDRLLSERRWRNEGSRYRNWRDPYWRSESQHDWSNPGWR